MDSPRESLATTFTVNVPVPHDEFCVKENEFEVRLMPAFREFATMLVLFDMVKPYVYGGVPPVMFAVTVCSWPSEITFAPNEIELNASCWLTVNGTEFDDAACDELSVISTLAYNSPVGPVGIAFHVNDADRFWLVTALAPTIELVE